MREDVFTGEAERAEAVTFADPSRACCVQCRHFSFDAGTPNWSDVTPGSNMSISCGRDRWRITTETTESAFRSHMETSRYCDVFESAG